jgi:voltage-gated potassium channel
MILIMTSERWNALWEWPLMLGAVTFLAAYAYQVLANVQGPPNEVVWLILMATWAMFAVNYAGALLLARQRRAWFVAHLLDLAIVALPVLRPLRLFRLLVLLAVFQRVAGRTMRGRVIIYVIGSTVMLVFVASLAVLDAERAEPGATIRNFGDAVWWACSTITTVGYGDVVPVSLSGRCIAVALMIGGIALLGTVTATLASWIVQRVAEEDEAGQAATRQQVEALTLQIAALHEQAALRDEARSAAPSPRVLTPTSLRRARQAVPGRRRPARGASPR